MLSLHAGIIQYVHPSGLVDVLSTESSRRYTRIPIMNGPIEQRLEIGDRVLLLSDGKQHYVMGTFRWPEEDEDGNITVRDLNNDLSVLEGTKSLSVSDSNGRQSRVVVGRGLGVLLDAGGLSFSHLGTDGKRFDTHLEKTEVSPHLFVDSSNGLRFIVRGTLDTEAIERDMTNETDTSLDAGFVLDLSIKEEGGIVLSQKQDGETKFTIESNNEGVLTISHSQEIEFMEDHPALAKMVHKMVIDAVTNIMSQMMVSDFGRPQSFSLDPIYSASNLESKDSLDLEYGTNDDTSLAFKKVKINGDVS